MISGENSKLNQEGRARDIMGEKNIAKKVQLAYTRALANGQGTITESLMTAELNKIF